MQDIARALKDIVTHRANARRTADQVRESAAAGAAYLELQLKEQKDNITLDRLMVVGLRSILHSASQAGG